MTINNKHISKNTLLHGRHLVSREIRPLHACEGLRRDPPKNPGRAPILQTYNITNNVLQSPKYPPGGSDPLDPVGRGALFSVPQRTVNKKSLQIMKQIWYM
jgi:hypothetical protein